jgi:hypothetical protein
VDSQQAIEDALKELKLVVNLTEGMEVSYEDVCYRSSGLEEGCFDSRSFRTEPAQDVDQDDEQEGDAMSIVFLLKDTPLARQYLTTLRELQHVTLGFPVQGSTTSIVLTKLPSEGSYLGMNAGINLEDGHRHHHSVLSLYPYSSLSIFTRTNGDVFTPPQHQPASSSQQGRGYAVERGRYSSSPFPSSTNGAGVPFERATSNLTSNMAKENNPARHIKFLAYALRALVTRFMILAKKADSADIFVVLLGYVLMHFTFARLFLNMRKMGSSFWLRESWSAGVRGGDGRRVVLMFVSIDP